MVAHGRRVYNKGPFLLQIIAGKGRIMEADGRTRYGRQVWKRLEGWPFSNQFYGRNGEETALEERWHNLWEVWTSMKPFMAYSIKFNLTYHKILPLY